MEKENNQEEKIVKEVKKEKEKVKEVKKQKALVTSRVLFISVLDKIFLVILGIIFVSRTCVIFSGSISSLSYGYFNRVFLEIALILGLVILYLFLSWIYNCAVKTVLCLTKNEVYREHYFPFKNGEESIPLNKITKVSTINLFWIFRAVIIHQYHSFPLIFWTWNNQEFKDKLTELITTDKEKVLNEYEEKSLISKSMYKYIAYIGGALAVIIFLLGIIKFGFFVFGTERRMTGTYIYNNSSVTLNKDGSCDLERFANQVEKCSWNYDNDKKSVVITYDYRYGYYSYTDTETITLNYDKKNKTLEFNGMILKK